MSLSSYRAAPPRDMWDKLEGNWLLIKDLIPFQFRRLFSLLRHEIRPLPAGISGRGGPRRAVDRVGNGIHGPAVAIRPEQMPVSVHRNLKARMACKGLHVLGRQARLDPA